MCITETGKTKTLGNNKLEDTHCVVKAVVWSYSRRRIYIMNKFRLLKNTYSIYMLKIDSNKRHVGWKGKKLRLFFFAYYIIACTNNEHIEIKI